MTTPFELHLTIPADADNAALRAELTQRIAETVEGQVTHDETIPAEGMDLREAILLFTIATSANVTSMQLDRMLQEALIAKDTPVVAVEVLPGKGQKIAAAKAP